MNTLEYNKRCAEFLGWVKYNGINPSFYNSYETNTIHFGEMIYYLQKDMKFHSDWNWIMEVLDKIDSLNIYYDKYIDYNSSMFSDGKIKISTNKTQTIEAINEFLIWLNENKEVKKWTPNRQILIDSGFYDGRFRNKIVKDKKKQLNKRICRIKIII